jgi:hypothetical protein
MKRKESKIPLFVTLVILAYFVFWAFGYVARNRPAPVEPVTAAQGPPDIVAEKPQQISQPLAPAQAPVVQQTPAGQAPKMEQEGPINPVDNTENPEVKIDGPVRNRKIMAIAEETTHKH